MCWVGEQIFNVGDSLLNYTLDDVAGAIADGPVSAHAGGARG